MCHQWRQSWQHGPLAWHVTLRVAHAPGMPGTLSPPLTSKETAGYRPGIHHGTCVMHVPWCMPESLTPGGGESVPGIPGACTTCNIAYLVRGPWQLSLSSVNIVTVSRPSLDYFWISRRSTVTVERLEIKKSLPTDQLLWLVLVSKRYLNRTAATIQWNDITTAITLSVKLPHKEIPHVTRWLCLLNSSTNRNRWFVSIVVNHTTIHLHLVGGVTFKVT